MATIPHITWKNLVQSIGGMYTHISTEGDLTNEQAAAIADYGHAAEELLEAYNAVAKAFNLNARF